MIEQQRGQMKITWIDDKREPRAKPNPLYPDGIDLDISAGKQKTCSTPLPYPARRCGHYLVICEMCGLRVIVTTAGRPDDPRSLKLACKNGDKLQ
jgi:hypothetical protein